MSADGDTVRAALVDGWCTSTEREAALAALARLEAERDLYDARACEAEAQRDALAEALREIAHEVKTRSTGVQMSGETEWPTPLHRSIYERARAALAEAGMDEKPWHEPPVEVEVDE